MAETFQIQTDGAQLAGEHNGAGDVLVFLHAGVADKRMWRGQIAEFGAGYHAIAYDRRGFGETTAPDEVFTHVDDLRGLLDHLGVETATLVGCSQGGRIAIDFTLAYPQRVTALVLIAPAMSGAPDVERIPPEIEALIDMLDAAEEADDLAQINAIEAHLWLDGPTSAEGRVGGDLRALFLAMNGSALAMPELFNEVEPPSAYDRVSDLSLPTLVIWGDLDFPHVKENCQYLVDTVPGATGTVIPDAAHLPNLEQPETINQLLYAFVRDRCSDKDL